MLRILSTIRSPRRRAWGDVWKKKHPGRCAERLGHEGLSGGARFVVSRVPSWNQDDWDGPQNRFASNPPKHEMVCWSVTVLEDSTLERGWPTIQNWLVYRIILVYGVACVRGWGGVWVGWGGLIAFPCTCTWCYATGCLLACAHVLDA